MLFSSIKTEKELDQLKRRVLNDKALYERILAIREQINKRNDRAVVWSKFAPYEGGSIKKMPTNAEMLQLYRDMIEKGEQESSKDADFLLKKLKVRSNSGVAVVSLLTKPYACPGRCIYCPTEKRMPKSYLSKEPAAARALANKFDAYLQITTRLKALKMNGHPIDKIEMILIGGTWSFYKRDYQDEFVSECFRACNNFESDTEIKKGELSLGELQKINETAKCRIIGLSIETRPDYINEEELNNLRRLGVTKVEIGVQHLDNGVLEHIKRGMTRERVAEATELLRNAGFKIVYHMMPNLPGSTPEMDVQMFRELFSGKDFHPDMLKIYPCVVLKSSMLYKIWLDGGFKAYEDQELIDVLVKAEREIPHYVRVVRMIRDIPSSYVMTGNKKSNLRETIDAIQKRDGFEQQEIRSREVRDAEVKLEDFELIRRHYETQTGREIFLSFENTSTNKLAAFVRLRLPKKEAIENFADNLSVLKDSAIIRELHTYGRLMHVGEEGAQSQHRGFGRRLLEEAERVAREEGYQKIAVISGVGVRGYYAKNGYELDRTYMVKSL